MCTVTFNPIGKNDFVLTSNRDESPNRKTFAPIFYSINNANVLFPKDELAGGTWVGVSELKRVICLLNGANYLHQTNQNYRLSRGLVVLDFLTSDILINTIDNYDLTAIQPFTMIIVDWGSSLKFYEFVWDGNHKNITTLPHEPKIWSSSTLYNNKMKNERLNWFEEFKKNNELNAMSILNFHKKTNLNNNDFGIIMDRGVVKTTSITQIEKCGTTVKMYFENLQTNKISNVDFKWPLKENE